MKGSERISTQELGTRSWGIALLLVSLLVWAGCGAGGPVPPVALEAGTESCDYCRMTISDLRFAGQIVAPGEEPLFFDDIGCLGNYLKQAAEAPRGAAAYVADHRTKAWLVAPAAVYTRVERIDTPMGSHLIAHADTTGRDADAASRAGSPATVRDIFGPSGPPDGSR